MKNSTPTSESCLAYYVVGKKLSLCKIIIVPTSGICHFINPRLYNICILIIYSHLYANYLITNSLKFHLKNTEIFLKHILKNTRIFLKHIPKQIKTNEIFLKNIPKKTKKLKYFSKYPNTC